MIKNIFLFLCLPIFLLLVIAHSSMAEPHTTTPNSDQITVTAVVPLSDLWRDTIAQKSQASVAKKNLHEQSIITTKIVGLDNELMKNETIKTQVYINGILLTEITEKTNRDGEAKFGFTPQDRGLYTVRFYNETYDKPFLLNQTLNLIYF